MEGHWANGVYLNIFSQNTLGFPLGRLRYQAGSDKKEVGYEKVMAISGIFISITFNGVCSQLSA
ncbi:MAG: hypothetical protein B6I32_08720 [Desulfobacterium sp. 4572_20]|nr:MAG: hypothetical protein B6I32_08720 [Desulfobacterium sp. 4572_20]